MTDKQIIECPFKGDDKRCNAHFNEVFWWKCYEFDNCLFKKYKAKEQECEELKNIINEAKNSKLDLKSFLVGEAIQNEYEQQLDQLKVKNIKISKTLTEIKEIAENVQSFVGRIDIEDDVFEQMEQILQKISECEVK